MSQPQYESIDPSRISQAAFEGVTWTFYTMAMIAAISRTTFRVYTFRKVDVDDVLLFIAVLALTCAVFLIHFLYPSLVQQNKVVMGQLKPGPEFQAEMLEVMKIESAASNLVWLCIYSVKYVYLFFFRKMLQRVRRMMIWWWIVFTIVTLCAIAGFSSNWLICPHFVANFLQICPVSYINARERIWLLATTVSDIISDVFIITVPILVLWTVKISTRAKLSIGGALCLSLFMVVIAVVRMSFGFLIGEVSDSIWIYYCWSLESSTAVFMISITAFRSTMGQHKSNKAKAFSKYSEGTYTSMASVPGRTTPACHVGRVPQNAMEWYDRDDPEGKSHYQAEIMAVPERERDMI